MNPKIQLLIPLLLAPLSIAQANEAVMRMNCTSVRVATATVNQSGQAYTLGFTTTDDNVNGEWAVNDGISYASYALLTFPGSGGPVEMNFYLDLPVTGDTDSDLVNDFFEVSKPLVGATSTTGSMVLDTGEDVIMGFIDATWNRAAGSATGTVQLRVNLTRDLFIPVVTFTHTFEIFQYAGKLTYAVKGPNVEASVDLARQGGAGQFTGPFPMGRRSHDVLERSDADWFGPGSQLFTVLGSTAVDGKELLLTRGGAGNTYQGSFYFYDGLPATPFLDEYNLWDMLIIDSNDADGNHIPDLTDGTEFVQPSGPVAKLVVTGGQLTLTITAKSGQQVIVEQSADLNGTTWEEVETRTLASDSEDVSLTSPTEDARFYRVRTL